MSTREEMLSQIRRALARPAGASAPSDLSLWPGLGQVMPAIGPQDLVARFEDEFNKVGGSSQTVQARSQISDLLLKLLQGKQAEGAVLSRNSLLSRLGLAELLNSIQIPAWTPGSSEGGDAGPERIREYRERCFWAAVGITGVDFALAETGSLVLSSQTEGSQLASLAPPVHVAFYIRSQLRGTLEEALQGLSPSGTDKASGRSIVFVTGTSRTADIEQILIRGVHGPREVHAVLVEECCLGD